MIHVFHGFLGTPADFDFLPASKVKIHDLYHFDEQAFLRSLKPDDVLLGYSMGGRLAMELAQKSHFAIAKIVLINAHPGLPDTTQLPERQIWEDSVYERLKTLPQSEFLNYWNKLPLFKADKALGPIDEERYLASAALFHTHRLSKQKNYVPLLAEHKDKVLWIAGLEDEKYAQVAREFIVPQGIHCEFICGGHRLFQKPESLLNLLKAHKLL